MSKTVFQCFCNGDFSNQTRTGILSQEFDADKNNKLNGNELEKVMLKKFVLKPKGDFTLIMNKFDKDQDGEWNAEEYLSFDKDLPFHEFEFDADKNNKLNGNELEKVMINKFVLKPKGDFTLIMNKFDKDKDGEWNAEEYLSFDKDLPFHELSSAAPAKNLRKKIESE
uniref:EF-hand domain-containing protein n=1 Tax=Rhabditophanes sp. KR3021 TaxID=114890 RepID=A0AC35U376_9BILA